MNLDRASVETYLTQRFKNEIQILSMQAFGDDASAADNAHVQLKTYGYGKPVLLHYRIGDIERRSVLRTMAPNAFGHERRADRAAGLLLSYDTFNIPDTVRVALFHFIDNILAAPAFDPTRVNRYLDA